MNKIKGSKKSNRPIVTINKELNKYETMPLFEERLKIAKEILQNTILPFSATITNAKSKDMSPEQLREKQNAYIKRCLDANMAVSNIAFLAELSPEEVTLRIEELKMTHKV